MKTLSLLIPSTVVTYWYGWQIKYGRYCICYMMLLSPSLRSLSVALLCSAGGALVQLWNGCSKNVLILLLKHQYLVYLVEAM